MKEYQGFSVGDVVYIDRNKYANGHNVLLSGFFVITKIEPRYSDSGLGMRVAFYFNCCVAVHIDNTFDNWLFIDFFLAQAGTITKVN